MLTVLRENSVNISMSWLSFLFHHWWLTIFFCYAGKLLGIKTLPSSRWAVHWCLKNINGANPPCSLWQRALLVVGRHRIASWCKDWCHFNGSAWGFTASLQWSYWHNCLYFHFGVEMVFFVPPKDGSNTMVLLSPVALCMELTVLGDGKDVGNGWFHRSRVGLIFHWCPFILFVPWGSHSSTAFSLWNVVLLNMEKTRIPVMGSFTTLNYTRKKISWKSSR